MALKLTLNLIVFAAIIGLLLAGCAKQAADETPVAAQEPAAGAIEPAGGQEETVAPAVQDTPQENVIETEISADTTAKIDGQLVPSSRFVVYPAFKKMSVGDSFVFGAGVMNINTKAQQFKVEIQFTKEASNIFPVNKTIMNTWFDETVFQFTLEPQEEKIIPLKFTAGDKIGSDSATKPGTYNYDVRVYNEDLGIIKIDNEYFPKGTITVQIK